MRVPEIHASAGDLIGKPLRWSSVQATLSAYTKAATVASVVLALEHNEVEEHNANVAESVLDLIRALWTRQSTLSTSSPTRHELLQRITAFITVNLGPPI